jgi:probable HAF family extracellular repeat protein
MAREEISMRFAPRPWLPLAALLLAPTAFAVPSFTPIPGSRSAPSAISADGTTVVGSYVFDGDRQPFRWTASTGTRAFPSGTLPPGDTFGSAAAVSDDGEIVGGGWSASVVEIRPQRCSSTSCIPTGTISSFAGDYGVIADLSSDATYAAGNAWYDGGTTPPFSVAVRWGPDGLPTRVTPWDAADFPNFPSSAFAFSEATAVSGDGSRVAGFTLVPTADPLAPRGEAFLWTSGGGLQLLGDLPGGTFGSSAHDISDDGASVVGSSRSALGSEAFLWTEAGGMIGLGDLPGGSYRSIANAVSADGSVVVGSSSGLGDSSAFIWDAERGMRTVAEVLAANGVDLAGWRLTGANDISADGRTITGLGINPSGFDQGWVAVIPEPGTIWLLGLGLVALARRRR